MDENGHQGNPWLPLDRAYKQQQEQTINNNMEELPEDQAELARMLGIRLREIGDHINVESLNVVVRSPNRCQFRPGRLTCVVAMTSVIFFTVTYLNIPRGLPRSRFLRCIRIIFHFSAFRVFR